MGKSLLDRAKEVMSGAGVLTSLAIAPLAMSREVRADSIQFAPPLASVTAISGGFGHASNFTLAGQKGVKLTGDTDVTGLSTTSGYLTAREAAFNLGKVRFDWGSQFDPDADYVGALSGDIHQGDTLNIMKNFAFQVNPATPLGATVPGLTWTLSVNIITTNPLADIAYVLQSGDAQSGNISGLDTRTFLADATAITWNVSLEFDWALDVGRNDDEFKDLVLNSNPNDRLQVNIPSSNSLENSMYISIDPQGPSGADVAAPLPSTAWMGGSLFCLVGVVRFRKSVLARLTH